MPEPALLLFLAPAGLLLAVAFVATMQYRPWLFIALIVVGETLLGGSERAAVLGNLRPGEAAMAIGVLGAMVSTRWSARRAFRNPLGPYVLVFVFTFSVLPLIHWALTGHAVNGEAVGGYGSTIKAGAIYAAVAGFSFEPGEVRRILVAVFAAVVASAVVAILQWLNVPLVWALLLGYFKSGHLLEDLEGTYHRATGLLANWHGLSASYTIALALGWNLRRGSAAGGRTALATGLCVIAVGLLTTETFIGLGGLAGFAFFLIWRQVTSRRRRLALLAGCAAAGTLGAVLLPIIYPERFLFGGWIPVSAYGRLYEWFFLFGPVIRANLMFGYGPSLPPLQIVSGASFIPSDDSQIISLLLRGGIIGLAGWSVMMVATIRHLRRRRRLSASGDPVVDTALTAALVLGVLALLQAFFRYPGVLELYWALVALTQAKPAAAGEEPTGAWQAGSPGD